MTTYLVQNDNQPSQVFTLADDTGTVVVLTGCTVNFYFKNNSSGSVVNDQHTLMTIVDPLAGIVQYVWDNHLPLTPCDLATPGEYTAEIRVTYPDGTLETAYDTFKYHVREKIGPVVP